MNETPKEPAAYPLKHADFRCPGECAEAVFKASRAEVFWADDEAAWKALCPSCGKPAAEMGYVPWQRAAQGKQTGPLTEEGKRKCRANAYQHGRYAQVVDLPPAKPGTYPECETCPIEGSCAETVKEMEATCQPVPCVVRLNRKMSIEQSVATGSPERIRAIVATIFAKQIDAFHACAAEVAARGPINEYPVITKDGLKVGTRLEANPAVKLMIEMLDRLGIDWPAFKMTPASQDETAAHGALPAGATLEYLRADIHDFGGFPALIREAKARVAAAQADKGGDAQGEEENG